MKYLVNGFTILLFLFSCGNKSETWINGDSSDPKNTIIFEGEKIRMTYRTFNDMGEEESQTSSFSIVDRIENLPGRDPNCHLYIMRDDANGKYSQMGEYELDPGHKKFSIRDALVQTDTRTELDNNLNEKMAIFRLGIDSAELKYCLMGVAKANGLEFSKQ
jgi:hypothetical protein